jgi:hypothetical protein
MVLNQDVITERQVLGDLHLPLPAQDSTGVELPVCGSLPRSARFLTRQRYMFVIGLITFLHLSDVIGQAFWNVQGVCGFILRGFLRKVVRRRDVVQAPKEACCDVEVW